MRDLTQVAHMQAHRRAMGTFPADPDASVGGVRLLDDSTVRAAGFTANINAFATNVLKPAGPMIPQGSIMLLCHVLVFPATANANTTLIIDNPTMGGGRVNVSGSVPVVSASGGCFSEFVVIPVNGGGQIRYSLASSSASTNRILIDCWAYVGPVL